MQNIFSRVKALKNTFQGLLALWQNEQAFRLEIYLSLVLTPIIFMLSIPVLLKLMLALLLLFLLLVEAINSAIEAVVDRISLEIHPQSALAKDMASAAVGIAILMNILVWIYAVYVQFA
jgi:diacylglycerol kinase (ATP)